MTSTGWLVLSPVRPPAKRRAIAVNLDMFYDARDFSRDMIAPGYKGSVLNADDDATLVNLVPARPEPSTGDATGFRE